MNLFPQQNPQSGKPNFDVNLFKQWLPNLNSNMMQQLIAEARKQGIPEPQIQEGLKAISTLR